MKSDSAIRIVIAIVLAIMFLAIGITGKPGSLVGSLIDADNMVEGQNIGGSAGGSF